MPISAPVPQNQTYFIRCKPQGGSWQPTRERHTGAENVRRLLRESLFPHRQRPVGCPELRQYRVEQDNNGAQVILGTFTVGDTVPESFLAH